MHHVALDRPGADDRDLDNEIIEAPGLHPRQHRHLRAALDLEGAERVGLLDHRVDRRIVVLEVGQADVIGKAGDYYRSPLFKGGAWRFAAVQPGALLRLAMLMRAELRLRGREGDPHQKARIGTAALAAESAELWVARACTLAEDPAGDPTAAEAYVNLARLAVERAALEVIQLVERGIGLSAFTRPNPIERVVRDLSTYLRQPFPDGALEDAAAFITGREGAPSWSVSADFPS